MITHKIDFIDASISDYQHIWDQLKVKKVSILVNNVGMGGENMRELFTVDPPTIESILRVNMIPQTLMTKHLIH